MPLPIFWRKPDSNNDNGNPGFLEKGGFGNDTIPILPPPTLGAKKTNSEMLDDLMQATYKSEQQGVDPPADAGTFGPSGYPDEKAGGYGKSSTRQPGFMDEEAYVALAGPPTPSVGDRRSKPVLRWLDDTKTPRQSEVPNSAQQVQFSNATAMSGPPLPALPVPWRQDPTPRQGPPLMPPEPAYRNNNRYTAATTTTQSSAAWFG
jgi:hypothetical protein